MVYSRNAINALFFVSFFSNKSVRDVMLSTGFKLMCVDWSRTPLVKTYNKVCWLMDRLNAGKKSAV